MTVVNTTPPTYYGLSTETKPTQNVPGGSAWMEEDTSKIFLFNEDANQWYEFGNAGGGGGSSNMFVVTLTSDDGDTFTADKEISDAFAAVEAGKVLMFHIITEGDHSWVSPTWCVIPDESGIGNIVLNLFDLSGPLDDSPVLVCDVFTWAIDGETVTLTCTHAYPVPNP